MNHLARAIRVRAISCRLMFCRFIFVTCVALCMLAQPRIAAQETRVSHESRLNGRVSRPRTPRLTPNNAAGTGILSLGNQISYHGGAVLLGTTHIYYIWYGNWDAGSIGILSNLAGGIGGSPYFNIDTGYFDGTGASISNSVTFAGSTHDNYSRGSSLRSRDIGLIVTNALSGGSLPLDPNGVYFVLTSSDVQVDGFPNALCGWHTAQSYQFSTVRFAFVGNPDPVGLAGCAEQISSPNGNAGADAMANLIAHELGEMVTDPNLDAWYDSSVNEVADKCAWTFGSTYTAINGSKANMTLGGRDFLIQQSWVNSSGGYCALSAVPAAEFALLATVNSQTVNRGGVTGSYDVSVIRVKGFAGAISFSVSGLPPGVSAGAITSSTTDASFTISTPVTLGGGSYPFTIKGTSGPLTHTASATLIVSGPVLLPELLSIGVIAPEPSQVGQAYSVSFSVTSTAGTPTGNVAVSDGTAECTATVAAGSCILTSTAAGAKTMTVVYAGDSQFGPQSATEAHFVTNGGSLAHLTSGAGWESTFTMVNLGPASASMSLNFFGDSGSALVLPFTLPQSSALPQDGSAIHQTMGSNSLLLLDTNPPGGQALSEGWASLSSSGDISAYEVFRYAPSGQEAVVPVESRNAASYMVMFDNTSLVNVLGTGVALANLTAQSASVSYIIRNDAGAQIGTGAIPVAALAHIAFTLSVQYPVTAGKRGTMEFFTPTGGQISLLAIRANGNAFTTIPVIASGDTGGGTMAHLVSGGGWRSVFSVVNPGTLPADITLTFFDDGGNPLSLPLTFLQTGATNTSNQVKQTLAAGASLTIQAQGFSAQVVLGSAQLATSGSASGFALFRYDPSGQEATVPFENRNAAAYVLAFDNTGPVATGVAIANISNLAANVVMTLRDDSGTTLQTATIQVAANGHSAFVLGGVYPLAAGRRGTVEFNSAGAQISVLGIRANGNAFTSIPVLIR